jgi:hypothetical protein
MPSTGNRLVVELLPSANQTWRKSIFADELPFKASIYKDANLPFLITEG